MSQTRRRGPIPGRRPKTKKEIEKIEKYLYQQASLGLIATLKEISTISNLSLPYICKTRAKYIAKNQELFQNCTKKFTRRKRKNDIPEKRVAAREFIEAQLKAGYVPLLSEICEATGLNSSYAKQIRQEFRMPRRKRNEKLRWIVTSDPTPRMKTGTRKKRTLEIEKEIIDLIGNGIPPNFAEIGDRHHLTRERIRQIASPHLDAIKALYEEKPELKSPSRRRK